MTKEEIVTEAIRRAQEVARKDGLVLGKGVTHPDDPITYELISITGDVATVGLSAKDSPTKQEIRKQFPVNELFDPRIAYELVESVTEEWVNKGTPSGSSMIIVKL